MAATLEADATEPSEAPKLGEVLSGGFRLIGKFVRWHPWFFSLAVFGAAVFVSAIVASAIVIGRIVDLVIIPVLDGGAEIGNTALYLVSDLSAGVTGNIQYLDAGYNIIAMPQADQA